MIKTPYLVTKKMIALNEAYWKKRCLAAEEFISEDIDEEQYVLYKKWQKIKSERDK